MSAGSFREDFRPIWTALRHMWPPILLIQAAAALVVWSFSNVDAARAVAATLSEWKRAGGAPFAFGAGMLSGGVLPEIAKAVTGRLGRMDREHAGKVLYTCIIWGFLAVGVRYFYELQNLIFGGGTDLRTAGLKTLLDQTLFSMGLTIPFTVGALAFRDSGWQLRRLFEMWTWPVYRRKVLPLVPVLWCYWIPYNVLTYLLPLDVQFPFNSVGNAAWSILVVFIVDARKATES